MRFLVTGCAGLQRGLRWAGGLDDSGSMPEELEPLVGTFIRLIDRYGAK